ncbi:hypothetical protein CVS40_11875 [Lucilia cuprina]|nr:hypothetical protein CVS40_11875 [Lucilia cuprina]
MDLIFVQSSFKINIYECLIPFSPSNAHHNAIILELNAMKFIKCTKSLLTKTCDYKNCNIDALNSALLNVDWLNLFYQKSTNISYDIFLNAFLNICDQYIPYKTYFSFSRRWYTKGLRILKNKRNKLHKRYLSSGSEEMLRQYKQCVKEFNFLNKFLYKQYIINIENNIKSNPNYFWSFIRSKKKSTEIPSSMIYENKATDNPEVIVNLFANFFKSNFDSSTSNSNFNEYITSNLNLGQIILCKDDILVAISRLKNSFQSDADGLSAFLIKKCTESIVFPILQIFNKSLSEGLFADRWKLTLITPIHKSGNRCDVSNYRLQSDLDNLIFWCNNNHLKFNLNKCIHISYSRSRYIFNASYKLGTYNIKKENEIMDLGILFDSKLTFKPHLDYLIPKAYSILAFLKRNCTEFLDPYTFKLLFSSFVRSKLEYGAIIWSPLCKSHITRIENIQRKFIRYALPHLNYIYPRPSYESRCLHLGMITLEKRLSFSFKLL